MVILARAALETNMGVRTSMNPLAFSFSLMAFSRSARSFEGCAITSLTPLSFADFSLDMFAENSLSLEAASSNSAFDQSSSPYSIKC